MIDFGFRCGHLNINLLATLTSSFLPPPITTMSPIVISNIVSLSLSITLVIAQSTFPATPLVSKHFAYPTGIVRLSCFLLCKAYACCNSLRRLILTLASFGVPNSAIMSVTRQPKIKARCVKPPSLMEWTVRVINFIISVYSPFVSPFRFLPMGSISVE